MKILDIHRWGKYSVWQRVFEPASDDVWLTVGSSILAIELSEHLHSLVSWINREVEHDCRASHKAFIEARSEG
jgi:hypothetical protein